MHISFSSLSRVVNVRPLLERKMLSVLEGMFCEVGLADEVVWVLYTIMWDPGWWGGGQGFSQPQRKDGAGSHRVVQM